METHTKTNLGRKGTLYMKRYNTFDSNHYFTRCDPIALVERSDILMASKGAGNTGVKNELVQFAMNFFDRT